MRVLVCGAAPRKKTDQLGWTDREVIKRQLEKLPADTVVIEGEALGADVLGREVALELGFKVEPYPAKWSRYGLGAGPIRNKQMLDEGKPDLVLAFHDNIQESKGTRNMVMQAAKQGIETLIISHKKKDNHA